MTSITLFLSHFHFIRPWWFLALIALFFALWLLKKHRFNHSPWNKFLPAHLSQVLVEGAEANLAKANQGFFSTQGNLIKPFIIGLLTIIALAGPTWQKLPQPVYQTERGSVLIMDMSYSMYATDIKPNRLTRARYKAIDLLNKLNEGDIGLIAYAGDAFVISPLTQDIKNIELLLPSLTPEIMPELGANPFAALSLAHDMLHNAGHINGDIYWFTDDVDNEDMSDIYDWSAKFGHQLNILGVGSQDGAPITLPSGELLKDDHGAIVVPKLPIKKLNALATRGNGHYQTINNNDSDIEKLLDNSKVLEQSNNKKQQSQQNGDQWQEQGPWLLIIALPLLLTYFRRGSAMLMVSSMSLPFIALLSLSLFSPNTFANEQQEQVAPQESKLQQTWQNLWQTDDQQAQQRYKQQDYQGAAQQFENDQWQGSAHYKAGNYQQALDAFKKGEQANSADSLYNQGNALAQMQQYEQAIEHYEQALEKNPDLADAKDNLEKIKQQQKKQEQEQKQQQDQQSKDSQSQDKQQQDKNDKQQQQSDDSQQQNDAEPQEKQQQQNKPADADKEKKKQKEQQKQPEQQKSPEPNEEAKDQPGENKTAAQIAAEQQAKETEQKHQQLLNKVTDDPYLLLRNKMQLEYQKRQQHGASQGVKKKW